MEETERLLARLLDLTILLAQRIKITGENKKCVLFNSGMCHVFYLYLTSRDYLKAYLAYRTADLIWTHDHRPMDKAVVCHPHSPLALINRINGRFNWAGEHEPKPLLQGTRESQRLLRLRYHALLLTLLFTSSALTVLRNLSPK